MWTVEAMKDRVARIEYAKVVAAKHNVDEGDVEHVLYNLTLPPLERLKRGMKYGKGKWPAYIRRNTSTSP